MQLKASVYLHFNHVAVNLWTETQEQPSDVLVIHSIRHTYAEVPELLADLSDTEQCLEALRWAVITAIRDRKGQDRQLGS